MVDNDDLEEIVCNFDLEVQANYYKGRGNIELSTHLGYKLFDNELQAVIVNMGVTAGLKEIVTRFGLSKQVISKIVREKCRGQITTGKALNVASLAKDFAIEEMVKPAASRAYQSSMQAKHYQSAAEIAKTYGLEKTLMIDAAIKAYNEALFPKGRTEDPLDTAKRIKEKFNLSEEQTLPISKKYFISKLNPQRDVTFAVTIAKELHLPKDVVAEEVKRHIQQTMADEQTYPYTHLHILWVGRAFGLPKSLVTDTARSLFYYYIENKHYNTAADYAEHFEDATPKEKEKYQYLVRQAITTEHARSQSRHGPPISSILALAIKFKMQKFAPDIVKEFAKDAIRSEVNSCYIGVQRDKMAERFLTTEELDQIVLEGFQRQFDGGYKKNAKNTIDKYDLPHALIESILNPVLSGWVNDGHYEKSIELVRIYKLESPLAIKLLKIDEYVSNKDQESENCA